MKAVKDTDQDSSHGLRFTSGQMPVAKVMSLGRETVQIMTAYCRPGKADLKQCVIAREKRKLNGELLDLVFALDKRGDQMEYNLEWDKRDDYEYACLDNDASFNA